MVRALTDTNVLISYLLHPTSESPPARLARSGISGAFTLLVTPRILSEVHAKVATKPYLSSRIPDNVLAQFLQIMIEYTHHVTGDDTVYPAIT